MYSPIEDSHMPPEGGEPDPRGVGGQLPESSSRRDLSEAHQAAERLLASDPSVGLDALLSPFHRLPVELRSPLLNALKILATTHPNSEIRIHAAQTLVSQLGDSDPSLARILRLASDPEIRAIGMDLTNRIVERSTSASVGASVIESAWNELSPQGRPSLIHYLSPTRPVIEILLQSESPQTRMVGALFALRTPDRYLSLLRTGVFASPDLTAKQARGALGDYLASNTRSLTQLLRSAQSTDVIRTVVDGQSWKDWIAQPQFVAGLCDALRDLIADRRWQTVLHVMTQSDVQEVRAVLANELPLEPWQPRKILILILESDDKDVVDSVVARLRTNQRFLSVAARFIGDSQREYPGMAVANSLVSLFPRTERALKFLAKRARYPAVREIAQSALDR